MGTLGFQLALDRGEPLADISVSFRDGVDYAAATQRINALVDDFDLWPGAYYNDPRLRAGTATRDALDRLFGWRLRRAPVPGGRHPGHFWWEEMTRPTRYPPGWEDLIESIGP